MRLTNYTDQIGLQCCFLERDLTRGQMYRVRRMFRDLDGDMHPRGEVWYYVGSDYIRYDELLVMYVADENDQLWAFSLGESVPVDKSPEQYFERVADRFREDLFATARCPECRAPLEASQPNRCSACHLVWEPL